MDTIIEVENLIKIYKKNFKKVYALKGVGFSVKQNQILGILGPNGAGKTTLLKIITGIIFPDVNSVKVELFGTTDIKSVKHRIGFLPENPEFFKNISAYELLDFSLGISGKPVQANRINQVLKNVGLLREKNERIKTFSKGMRQRIGIAQAIIHEPELLILDEPMSGLDPQGRRMVIDFIQNYYKEGKTILFSTHNLDDIEALCTDVMVLNKGEIQLEKSLSQLREYSNYKIEAEDSTGKISYKVNNQTELWDQLDQLKKEGKRIVRIQSGIADQLESFYKGENSDETGTD